MYIVYIYPFYSQWMTLFKWNSCIAYVQGGSVYMGGGGLIFWMLIWFHIWGGLIYRGVFTEFYGILILFYICIYIYILYIYIYIYMYIVYIYPFYSQWMCLFKWNSCIAHLECQISSRANWQCRCTHVTG